MMSEINKETIDLFMVPNLINLLFIFALWEHVAQAVRVEIKKVQVTQSRFDESANTTLDTVLGHPAVIDTTAQNSHYPPANHHDSCL